jgi:hypothetical protein
MVQLPLQLVKGSTVERFDRPLPYVVLNHLPSLLIGFLACLLNFCFIHHGLRVYQTVFCPHPSGRWAPVTRATIGNIPHQAPGPREIGRLGAAVADSGAAGGTRRNPEPLRLITEHLHDHGRGRGHAHQLVASCHRHHGTIVAGSLSRPPLRGANTGARRAGIGNLI